MTYFYFVTSTNLFKRRKFNHSYYSLSVVKLEWKVVNVVAEWNNGHAAHISSSYLKHSSVLLTVTNKTVTVLLCYVMFSHFKQRKLNTDATQIYKTTSLGYVLCCAIVLAQHNNISTFQQRVIVQSMSAYPTVYNSTCTVAA